MSRLHILQVIEKQKTLFLWAVDQSVTCKTCSAGIKANFIFMGGKVYIYVLASPPSWGDGGGGRAVSPYMPWCVRLAPTTLDAACVACYGPLCARAHGVYGGEEEHHVACVYGARVCMRVYQHARLGKIAPRIQGQETITSYNTDHIYSASVDNELLTENQRIVEGKHTKIRCLVCLLS